MSISIAELKKLAKDSYELLDIRSEVEISHGAIPGAIAVKPEEIEKKLKNKELDPEKKQVICCSRGKISVEIAEELEEEGKIYLSKRGKYCKGEAKKLTGRYRANQRGFGFVV